MTESARAIERTRMDHEPVVINVDPGDKRA
jgi:hypothetical protein